MVYLLVRPGRAATDAYALDLLVARMQNALLRGSGQLGDLKVDLMDRLTALQMHLNPVREKAEVIKRVKSDAFWEGVTVQALEEVRVPLREIMHHHERGSGQPLPPKVVDITEGPPEPNIFKDLDGDVDGKLSKEEVLAFFKKQGRDELPEGLWEKEDKNEDGVISWEEFSGPKGKTAPPLKDEV